VVGATGAAAAAAGIEDFGLAPAESGHRVFERNGYRFA
jgi:hypothetical protein